MATLRWPFLWLFRLPEVRQQLVNEVVLLRGQALKNIFEVEVGVMPIHFGALNQTHDRCCPFASPQGSSEQPVAPANGDGPDGVFYQIVINGQLCVIDVPHQRIPPLDGVVHGPG